MGALHRTVSLFPKPQALICVKINSQHQHGIRNILPSEINSVCFSCKVILFNTVNVV